MTLEIPLNLSKIIENFKKTLKKLIYLPFIITITITIGSLYGYYKTNEIVFAINAGLFGYFIFESYKLLKK